MKYESMRKTSRDNRIRKYAKEHPEKSQAELGKRYGISQVRICQILKAGEVVI